MQTEQNQKPNGWTAAPRRGPRETQGELVFTAVLALLATVYFFLGTLR